MEDFVLGLYSKKEAVTLAHECSSFGPDENPIAFIRAGYMELEVNGEIVQHHAGSVVFMSSRSSYGIVRLSEDFSMYVMKNNTLFSKAINYNFNRYQVYHAIMVSHKSAVSVPPGDFANILAMLDVLHYTIKQNGSYIKELVTHLSATLMYVIVGHLKVTPFDHPKEFKQRKGYIAAKFMENAFTHFLTQRELSFYANELNVSIKYLSMCVKEVTGYSPRLILSEFLADNARDFLANKDVPISEIADKLGFSDQYAFSKFFKKNSGISPTVFRSQVYRS